MIGKNNDHLIVVAVRRDQLRNVPTSPTTYQLDFRIYVAGIMVSGASALT